MSPTDASPGWSAASHAPAVVEAATALAVFAATSDGLTPRPAVRREILRLYAINLVTQGTLPSKGATRFVSTGARRAPAGAWLEHEHVHTRAFLTDLILANPNVEAIHWILANLAIAATVTKAEHGSLTRLPKGIEGWARYRAAEVEVIDLATGAQAPVMDQLPDWLLVPGGPKVALRLPSDALSRLLAHDGLRALLDPEVTGIPGATDWPTRRAEAFEVIEIVARAAGQGFPSRESAALALFQHTSGFGVRQWLQDLVLDMLSPAPLAGS